MRVFSLVLTVLIILAILSLSQAAGRFLGFHEYLTASEILALIVFLAVVSVLFIWRSGKTIFAIGKQRILYFIIVYVIIVSGLAFIVGYLSYYPAPYPFSIEKAAITVSVNDIEGTSGHVDGSFQIKALRDGLEQILWGHLGSTGIIRNVTTSESNNERTFEITQQSGEWQIKIVFPKPLKKEQQVSFHLGFDVVGSEPGGDIYWEHAVTFPTQNLQMTIIVPKGRPCKAADARSEDAVEIGAKRRDEPPPILSDDNTKLTWTKADPQEERTYIVTCH